MPPRGYSADSAGDDQIRAPCALIFAHSSGAPSGGDSTGMDTTAPPRLVHIEMLFFAESQDSVTTDPSEREALHEQSHRASPARA